MKSSFEMSRSRHICRNAAGTWSANTSRLHARLLRRPLDLLPVLVGAGQEEHVVAQQPPRPRDRIRQHRRVGVADVGRALM